jgi:cell division septal protein FtsQ
MITTRPRADGASHLPIDPRIQERRVEVQRANGRRRLNLLLGSGTAVALIAVTFGLLHTPLASVRDTRISAIRHETNAVVLAAAGISPGEPLIDINASQAASRIEALPWVQSATVRRSWPSTVVIRLVERHAVAQVPVGGAVTGPVELVDGTGRVLQEQRSPASELPFVLGIGVPAPVGHWLEGSEGPGVASTRTAVADGLRAPPSALAAALALARSFTLTGLAQSGHGVGPEHAWIRQVNVTSGDTLSAVAEPAAATFAFGVDSNLPAKLDAVIAVLSDVSVPAGSTVDLSDPNRPTITSGPAVPAHG